MKRIWVLSLALAFCLALAPMGALAADQLPSCADLEEMANTLDQAADALAKVGSIERGSELDKALRNLINALADVANIERNQDLADAVNLMGKSWKHDDWEPLKEGLDNAIDALDQLLKRDCT
ncbi:MAG: hypothetical protein K9K65_17095 [Desulfarculaceae bacterium]|nr:hypothetical protein [Desulfarculaceae bacterium]MCF8049337.1 hypothetical protein [Desulfarculaceae bacterium]MCF8065684.1 hypothetical protein [Desulfarculaceae bacterium]MCF8099559.1 hypothetical protein [Desulfarculaceae bacterium]MCF8124155.1 hypothetical protein [Desulfarculaceae bacterium]